MLIYVWIFSRENYNYVRVHGNAQIPKTHDLRNSSHIAAVQVKPHSDTDASVPVCDFPSFQSEEWKADSGKLRLQCYACFVFIMEF